MPEDNTNTVDLLTRQLQAMWSGDDRAGRWVTDHSLEAISSLNEPLPFYLVEPLVTGRTCLAFTEADGAKDFAHRLRKEVLPFSHEEIGNAASDFALDLLWKRSRQHQLANLALMGCLTNFCLFETGYRILNETVPTGHLRFGGLLFYARKKFTGDGDVVCRPFAGHTPEPFSEEEVMSVAAGFVKIDAGNHPEMRKRYPINKFLKKYR